MHFIGEVITFNNPYVFFFRQLVAENLNCDRKYSFFITFILAIEDEETAKKQVHIQNEKLVCDSNERRIALTSIWYQRPTLKRPCPTELLSMWRGSFTPGNGTG